MKIQTASIYAKQGYRIFRNPAWLDPDTGKIAKSLYVLNGDWVIDDSHWYILSVEDVEADDWEMVKE